MTIEVISKQYLDAVCQLNTRRKFLKEQLTKSNDLREIKDFEKRIALLTEEISETKEIGEFLLNRYGGGCNGNENIAI
ncbi:MAG: hypothetical protein RSC41_00355 [Oscillospiraceae bacterium]